nr:ribulose-phosphate 3-epimerase [Mycoplasmopsis bovis]
MIENPLDYIDQYKDVVDIVTVHYEAIDPTKFLKFLKQKHHDYRLGIAIKPNTDVEKIKKFLPYIQLVLVMSVEPGKGGQKFIPTAIDKIKMLKQLRINNNYDYLIQVDGGINDTTGPECFKAGADACVAGTFMVSNPTKARINSILGVK